MRPSIHSKPSQSLKRGRACVHPYIPSQANPSREDGHASIHTFQAKPIPPVRTDMHPSIHPSTHARQDHNPRTERQDFYQHGPDSQIAPCNLHNPSQSGDQAGQQIAQRNLHIHIHTSHRTTPAQDYCPHMVQDCYPHTDHCPHTVSTEYCPPHDTTPHHSRTAKTTRTTFAQD